MDGDRDLRQALHGLLGAAGHRISTLGDPLDALFRVAAGGYDVLVVDLLTGGSPTGIELARVARTHGIEVIVTTSDLAWTLPPDLVGPAVRILYKPLNPLEVLAAIDPEGVLALLAEPAPPQGGGAT